MSDSIFDYPEIPLKIGTEPAQKSERKVIITYSQPKKTEFYYNKSTFNYDAMFIDMLRYSQPHQKSKDIQMSLDIAQRGKEGKKMEPDLSLSIEEEEEPNKKMEGNQYKILEELKESKMIEESNPVVEVVEVKVRQKQDSSSQIVDQSRCQPQKKVPRAQNSQISGLSQYIIQSQEPSSVGQHPSMQSHREQADPSISFGLSSIHPNQTQEDLITLLDKFNEQSDNDNPNEHECVKIDENLERALERDAKVRELEGLPWGNLAYRLKTQKCCKITLKWVVDVDNSLLQIRKPKPTPYLTITNQKISIPSPMTDSIVWRVGVSKIKLLPVELSLICYHCGRKTRGKVCDMYCLTMCQNAHCNMEMVVEIVEVYFHTQKQEQW